VLVENVWSGYIGGWLATEGAGTFDVHEPATGELLATVVASSDADVARAVAEARRAYDEHWRHTTPRERATLMRQVAQVIREHADEIAELEAREVGKPKRDALRFDVAYSSSAFDYYGGLAETLHGEIIDSGPIEARIKYEPYGVVAAILPFNWPPLHFSKKCAPALAAGNTVVLKPAELTPLTALRFAEIAQEAGLPEGIVNVVVGPGATCGQRLVEHPDVAKIAFTGSTEVGRRIAAAAAETIKRVTLELGGKSANVILPDADLGTAVKVGVAKAFTNAGQTCNALTRMLVHRDSYDEAVALAAKNAERYVPGDPMADGVRIGPLVSAAQRDRVTGFIEQGLAEGARAVVGGPGQPAGLDTGYYVMPTVFAGVTPDMVVAREEIFGPVLCVLAYDTEDEAVDIANGTPYGLAAAVWSADQDRAVAVGRRLRAGQVEINGGAFNVAAPFGGFGQSGYGRELGRYGLEEFLEIKSLQF